jgi:hypothetical protein
MARASLFISGLGFASSVAVAPADLRPIYHFTRLSGEMNDPNGLMYTTDDSTGFPTHEYHLYFQSNDPGQPPPVGSIWGHATSPDMVRWTRMARTGIKGSSGGGVATPAGFVGADGAPWRAVTLASVPAYPPRRPAVGLSVWHSEDAHLANWTVYDPGPGGGGCAGTTSGSSGVVCPALVPDQVRAGYIGDNYVWKEEAPPLSGNWTYYALSGTNKCPVVEPWCGYAFEDATPQALLFSSPDLAAWRFESVFWDGEDAAAISGGKNRMDTPDTFAVPGTDPELQAVVWLASGADGGNTVWMTGPLARSGSGGSNMSFSNVTAHGDVDSGSLVCSQSFTDPLQRRVLFGWVALAVEGQPYSGAQTMPRQVVDLNRRGANPNFAPGALGFEPLEEVWELHGAAATPPPFNATASDAPTSLDAALAAAKVPPLHHHLQVDLSLLAPPAGVDGVEAVVHVLGGQQKGGVSIAVAATAVVPPRTPAPTPKPVPCTAGEIYNGTDNKGTDISSVSMNVSVFGMEGARQCQQLCCQMTAPTRCMAWTYSDPQPGSGGKKHDCFLKSSSSLVKSACGDGHCWSGQVAAPPPAPTPPPSPPPALLLRVNGGAALGLHSNGAAFDVSSRLGVRLDIFVDGGVVEVFANGGEHAVTASAPKATDSSVSVAVTGAAKPVACGGGAGPANNTDSSGAELPGNPVSMPASAFGPAAAEQCEQLCCETAGCGGWTFTDPQPGAATHDCWLKGSGAALIPNGCDHYGSGHCWSGLVTSQGYDAAAHFSISAWEMKQAVF